MRFTRPSNSVFNLRNTVSLRRVSWKPQRYGHSSLFLSPTISVNHGPLERLDYVPNRLQLFCRHRQFKVEIIEDLMNVNPNRVARRNFDNG